MKEQNEFLGLNKVKKLSIKPHFGFNSGTKWPVEPFDEKSANKHFKINQM
jgi:hypothetical protein